jgi:hypothetical protein
VTPALQRFHGDVYRIVETQEVAATTKIVHNLADQSRLEELLEESKPAIIGDELHYLLSTPFRYPPLRHGSRFGARFEPGLFYGSLERNTCLAECAYYRLMFYLDMQVPPPRPITTQHTIFQVLVDSPASVDLRPDTKQLDEERLRHCTDYSYTQQLGTQLRLEGVHVLLFMSARDPCKGSNIALYTPSAFAETKPHYQEMWQSQVDGSKVVFRGVGGIAHYLRDVFCDSEGSFLRINS